LAATDGGIILKVQRGVSPNGLALDAVGGLEAQMFNKPQKLNRSTNVEFTTSAPIAFKPLLPAALLVVI
jgi:hypothetical protein